MQEDIFLQDLLKGYNILLLSKSPRRKFLLQDARIEFTVPEFCDVDESYPDNLPAIEVAEYLSKVKSEAYKCDLQQKDIVITADTTVVVDNIVLGKPKEYNEAYGMLKTLSGRGHKVVTGVTLRSMFNSVSFSVVSDVFFKDLSHDEIDYYIKNYLPYDKAGGYGIQQWIGYVAIERIEGCYYNIMGLPINRLLSRIKEILSDVKQQ